MISRYGFSQTDPDEIKKRFAIDAKLVHLVMLPTYKGSIGETENIVR